MLSALLARYGYVRREYPRINNGSDAIVRGQRWEQFYSEEGGLADMIGKLRQSYFEKYAKLKPDDMAGRERLALIDYLAQELDGEVRSIIDTGRLRTPRNPA